MYVKFITPRDRGIFSAKITSVIKKINTLYYNCYPLHQSIKGKT